MSKKAPASETEALGELHRRGPNLQDDIEANISDHAAGQVDESVPFPEFLARLEQDEIKPGAYAMPGDHDSTSFHSSSQHSSPEPAALGSSPPVLEMTPLHAEPVDVEAEEQRERELERRGRELKLERERNRALQNRIQQIESEAVVAIPVPIEDANRAVSANTTSQTWTLKSVFQNKRNRRRFAVVFVLVVAMAVIIGSVLGVLLPREVELLEWTQLGQTLQGNGTKDYFGFSVALAANGTVVAGPGFGENGHGMSAGYVRVFSYNSGSWEPLGQDLNGKAAGDEFGTMVVLSQDGTVVAASAIRAMNETGYVQVHRLNRDTGFWVQMGQDLNGTVAGALFGSSLALSADGNVVAAGGPGLDYNESGNYSGNQKGYVQVYEFNHTEKRWRQMGEDLKGAGIGAAYGRAVALSGNGTVLAVGADWSGGNGANPGLVQVFAYNGKRWKRIGQDLVGEGSQDYSGYALDLSKDGAIVAVGALWNDGAGGPDSGHVRVFSYNQASNHWNSMGQEIDGRIENGQFGISVALSADGTTLAAGANPDDGNGGELPGHVRVFSFDNETNSWDQIGEDIDGEEAGDRFGVSVALSSHGSIVGAGAHRNDGNGPNSGHVRVFQAPESSNR